MNLETALTTPPTPAPVYLDRSNQAIAPAGCLEAAHEAEWLRLALDNGPLLIRGRTGEKAALFYAGRGRTCQELLSPQAALEILGVDAQGLLWIRAQWGEGFGVRFAQLQQPLRPGALLAVLFPAAGVAWLGAPSREHAARWLLWRAESAPEEMASLIEAQAAQWRSIAPPDLAPFYAPTDPQSARQLLSVWLGLQEAGRDFPLGAGVFPLAVPASWQDAARGQWMANLAERGVAVWDEVRARPLLGDALRREAATATAKFLSHHPQHIREGLLGELGEYLAPDTLSSLQDLVPPLEPAILPLDASAVEALRWFQEDYWPFRHWQSRLNGEAPGADAAQSLAHNRQVTRLAAHSFGRWYLSFYARALAGGAGLDFVAGSRVRALRDAHVRAMGDGPGSVTLLVIVDGLHEGDATALRRRLKGLTGRLEVLETGRAFTVLPTITEIAKPALWWGLPSREAAPLTAALGRFYSAADGADRAGTRAFSWPNSPCAGRELKEHADVSVLQQAGEGEIWVWNILALDTAYHKNYPPATTLQEAGQVLDLIASRIVAAAEAIPEHLSLRIVISADHGRLPGPSQRCHPAPAGCETHGRAALVRDVEAAPALAFTEQDYIWESDAGGERVWLNAHRFGLSAPAVVCADENAFALSGGAHTEHFSHGGLWPEEIVVPWIVLARDQGVPHIEATVGGKAKAGALGILSLKARNGSEMSLILQEVCLVFGPRDERTMGISQSLPPLGVLTHELALPRWPDSLSAGRAKATLVFSRPDGSRFEVEAATTLESEELYRASSILEDFDI